MAKPRVFISSTYYDLKYVRERLTQFLAHFGFETVLFENDNIFFDYKKDIDESCYDEVKSCHFMVLIVGGRYGSAATGEEDKVKYNQNYVSITRKEYETAIERNIPISIFIEKSVYSEYLTFNKNRKHILKYNPPLDFAHVDDINIFYFIDKLKAQYIKEFSKIEDIENNLLNQISGMIYSYLKSIQDSKIDKRILDSVDDLKEIVGNIKTMVNEFAKDTIGDERYRELNNQSIENTVQKFASKFVDNTNISFSRKLTNEELEKLADICCDSFFENKKYLNIEGVVEYIDSYYEHLFSNILEALGKNLISAMSSSENIKEIYKYYIEHIYPLYEENKAIKNRTKEVFKEKLTDKISKNYKSNNR